MRVACVDDPRWTDKEHGDGSDNCKSIRAKLAKPEAAPADFPARAEYEMFQRHFCLGDINGSKPMAGYGMDLNAYAAAVR
jgi:hypothetical protein